MGKRGPKLKTIDGIEYCKRDHAMIPENLNTYVNKYGKTVRDCKLCKSLKQKKARKNEEPSDFKEQLLKKVIIKDGHWFFDGARKEKGSFCFCINQRKYGLTKTFNRIFNGLNTKEKITILCGIKDCCNPEHLKRTLDTERYCDKGHLIFGNNEYSIPGIKKTRCKKCMIHNSVKTSRKIVKNSKRENKKQNLLNCPEAIKYFEDKVTKENDHWIWNEHKYLTYEKAPASRQSFIINNVRFDLLDVAYASLHGIEKLKKFTRCFCDNEQCCNPKHLLTSDKMLFTKRTVCSKGHAMTEDNIKRVLNDTKDACLICYNKNLERKVLKRRENERNRTATEHSDRVEQTGSQTVAQQFGSDVK